MDGNDRWAKKNNLSIYNSYKNGANNLLKLTQYIFKNHDIDIVSAFALSSHNFQRPKKIISYLIKVLDEFSDLTLDSFDRNYGISFIGDFNFLPNNIISKLKQIEKINYKSKKKLLIFINYSGKNDILNASKTILVDKKNINIKNFEKNLKTYNFPDPDLIIRTGGYKRLSDFMLYQSSFTEFEFSKKLWSDFNATDLNKIIISYFSIVRKFGR